MGRRIRRVSGKLLAAVHLTWEDEAETSVVDEYTYDPANPREFYVNPPNDGTGAVRAVFSSLPDALDSHTTLSEDEDAWRAQVIDVPDEYVEALCHFAIHRAFLKEAEWSLDPVRAKQHFELYLEALGTKTQQDREFSSVTE